MRGDPCFMVTKESACRIGAQDNIHEQKALQTDHSSLVKFSSPEDDCYQRVRYALSDLVEKAPGAVRARFSDGTSS